MNARCCKVCLARCFDTKSPRYSVWEHLTILECHSTASTMISSLKRGFVDAGAIEAVLEPYDLMIL